MQRAGDIDAARVDDTSPTNPHSNHCSRAWDFFRRHIIAIVMTAIVAAGVTMAQLRGHEVSEVASSYESITEYTYGWPVRGVRRWVNISLDVDAAGNFFVQSESVSYEWHIRFVALDIAVVILLVTATMIAGELVSRRHIKGLQFRLSHILAATLIVAILLTCRQLEADIYPRYAGAYPYSLHPTSELPLYTSLPLYLGMACVLAVALTAIAAGIRRMRR